MTNCQTIGFCLIVGIIGGYQTTGTGHIIDNDRRLAGEVFAQVTSYGAGIRIKTTARREADNDSDGLALKVRSSCARALEYPISSSKHIVKENFFILDLLTDRKAVPQTLLIKNILELAYQRRVQLKQAVNNFFHFFACNRFDIEPAFGGVS